MGLMEEVVDNTLHDPSLHRAACCRGRQGSLVIFDCFLGTISGTVCQIEQIPAGRSLGLILLQ